MKHWLVPFCFVLAAIWFSLISKHQSSSINTVTSLNTSYDYIIVGGGTAGLVLANRLTEDNDVMVLVLEAGNDESNKPVYDIPYNAPKAQMTEADWQYYTVPQKHAQFGMKNQVSYWPQGKGLGGSTLVNGLAYIRGSRYDFDEWKENGCEGWGYDDILHYFLKSERMRTDTRIDKDFHSTDGFLSVSDTTRTEVADVFLAAGKEIGYNEIDCNGNKGNSEGFCGMYAVVGDGVRCTAARAFLQPITERPNLHVSVRSFATKIIFDKKRATGVTFVRDARKFNVFARKEVILSAGAIGSAKLLMLSGIGPKEHLTEMKIPMVADLAVGEELRDHMMFFMRANITKPVSYTMAKVFSTFNKLQYSLFSTGPLTTNGGLEGNAFIRTNPDSSHKYPDIQFVLVSSLEERGESYDQLNLIEKINKVVYEAGAKQTTAPEGFSIAIVLIHPESRGHMLLKSVDPFDYPLLDPNYLADKEDIKTFIRGIRIYQKLLKTKSMEKLGTSFRPFDLPICEDEVPDSDEYWECLVRHLALTIYHPVSTCKMGSLNDSTTVVDPELRVKGISGLRVVDASAMPSLPSGNPMAAVYMIAEKAADLIRNKHL